MGRFWKREDFGGEECYRSMKPVTLEMGQEVK